MHAHSHAPGESHGHSRVKDRKAITIALSLILAFMAAEVAAGILAGSLALARRRGSHAHRCGSARGSARRLASRVASGARGVDVRLRTRRDPRRAGATASRCSLLGVWIVYSAVRRLVDPPDVHGGVVLVVALVGVVVNLAATLVLARADRSSLNVEGAFLHIATDLVAFVGTAIAGALILLTGWNRLDPIAGLLVAALMVRSSWTLIRESGRIFLEAAPAGIDPDAVARALVDDPDVVEVHDLHVWTVTSGFPALAAHVLVEPGVDCHDARRRLQHLLEERFDLHHTTLQVDHLARRAQDVTLELRERS